ncbi:MAG: hypothetical protein ACRCY8_15945 [Dermatophilaceae bacterium]
MLTRRQAAALAAAGAAAAPLGAAATTGPTAAAAEPQCETERFDDPGAGLVEWTVPPGTTEVRATLAGGRGGDAVSGGFPDGDGTPWRSRPAAGGGRGAVVTGSLDVQPGDIVAVTVGGGASGPAGGANGGGDAAAGPFYVYPDELLTGLRPGGGGGASDVRVAGGGLADRVLVAGGGGGAGAISWSRPFPGGTASQLGTPMPPDLVGDGGDAGSAGGASQGWVDATQYEPFDGTAVEGRTRVSDVGPQYENVEGRLSPGAAGGPGSGGAPGIPTFQPAYDTGLPIFTGEPGALGRGGDGGRSTPWFSRDLLIATAGGAGGGGVYGGGGGGGMGVFGSSSPVSGLVSGGGGGSSLGAVAGLHDGIDGYVEIVACRPGPDPTPSPSPSASPSPSDEPAPISGSGAGGGSGTGGVSGGPVDQGSTPEVAQSADALADTGPGRTAPLALLGAVAIATGSVLIRVARSRKGR